MRKASAQLAAQRCRQVGHLVECVGSFAVHPLVNLAGAIGVDAAGLQPLAQVLAAVVQQMFPHRVI